MFPPFRLRRASFSGMLVALLLASAFAFGLPVSKAWAASTSYYLDCSASSNGSGTQTSPWNALSSVNTHAAFTNGDQILLKRGTTCSGALTPPGSGASGSPITLDAYGSGALPIISAGSNASAISLYNQQYWHIQNIETTGGSTHGISVSGDVNGVLQDIHITNVAVHDVSGTFVATKNDGLITIVPNSSATTFDDVLIDGATAYNSTQWTGIVVGCGTGCDGWTSRSSNATIRNSTVHDVQGDGIVFWEVNNGTLDNNIAYRTGLVTNPPSGLSTPGGIWEWRCNSCLLQNNETYDNHSYGSNDGLDYDIDASSSNVTLQYNYGHDSYGPCITMDDGDPTPNNNNIVRYNVCANNGRNSSNGQGDFAFLSTAGGSINNTQVYNNTFFWNPAGNTAVVQNAGVWSSGGSNNVFANNIIYSTKPSFINSDTSMSFDHNLYWYTGSGAPSWTYNGTTYTNFTGLQSGSGQDTHGQYTDPRFVNIAANSTSPTGRTGVIGAFSLQGSSPAIDAGENVCAGISGCSMGGRDFADNATPQGSTYDIGALEYTNLVTNGGFESGSSPWNIWGAGYIANTNAHSGTYAAASAGQGGAEQTISNLLPNTTYTLSGWAKSSDGTSQASIGAKNFGGSQILTATSSTIYVPLSTSFTTGATNTSATIFFYELSGSGTIYGDDVTLTVGSPVAGTQLYLDTFESDTVGGAASGWSPSGGTWTVCQPPSETKEYCKTDTSDNFSTAGTTSWTNYAIQGYINIATANTGDDGLLGRVQDTTHFYGLYLGSAGGVKNWSLYVNNGGNWTRLATDNYAWSIGTWYNLRLSFIGSSITASISSDYGSSYQPLGSVVDSTLATGAIGVTVNGNTAHFDEVTVTEN